MDAKTAARDVTLNAALIREALDYLYQDNGPPFTSDRYTQEIDPYWFSTPHLRGLLWGHLARIVDADPDYGTR